MKKFTVLTLVIASSLGLAACGKKVEDAAAGATGAATNTMSSMGDSAMGGASNVVSGAGNVIGGATNAVVGGATSAVDGAVDKVGGMVGDKAKDMGVPTGAADAAVKAGTDTAKEKMQ
jgi:hypothetical protein